MSKNDNSAQDEYMRQVRARLWRERTKGDRFGGYGPIIKESEEDLDNKSLRLHSRHEPPERPDRFVAIVEADNDTSSADSIFNMLIAAGSDRDLSIFIGDGPYDVTGALCFRCNKQLEQAKGGLYCPNCKRLWTHKQILDYTSMVGEEIEENG
jgi:exosome complex RNA-binding protein Csl4